MVQRLRFLRKRQRDLQDLPWVVRGWSWILFVLGGRCLSVGGWAALHPVYLLVMMRTMERCGSSGSWECCRRVCGWGMRWLHGGNCCRAMRGMPRTTIRRAFHLEGVQWEEVGWGREGRYVHPQKHCRTTTTEKCIIIFWSLCTGCPQRCALITIYLYSYSVVGDRNVRVL